MQITLHIYRTHDHDLMSLHQAGVLSIGLATKKAVIAYYKGEPLSISTKTTTKVDASLMPLAVTFSFVVNESDAEGITKWIQGIHHGYRNCFFKNVLRHYLDDPATFLFRDDAWQAVMSESTGCVSSINIPVAPKKKKEELMGSAWVNAVAKEEKKKYTNKKISDLDVLLGKASLPEDQEVPIDTPPVQDKIEEKEDAFDPYDAYLQLKGGA